MSQLETLNLEQTRLQSLILGHTFGESLRSLQLLGNPLRCDCHARWLWVWARNDTSKGSNGGESDLKGQGKVDFQLPKCATPFSVRNRDLVSLGGTRLRA